MKYYKQFHTWPYAYLIALACASVLGYLALAWEDPIGKLGIFMCAAFALFASWILWKGQEHYIEINQDWIVHQGFKHWQVGKTDVIRVEYGRKGWADDNDPYITIHAGGREYRVEDGFLADEKQIDELVQAMQNRPA